MIEFLSQHRHLLAYGRQIIGMFILLALVTAVFAPLEALLSVRKAKFFYPGWSINLGWYFIDGLGLSFLLGPPAALIAWLVHAIIPASFTHLTDSLSFWPRAGLALFVGEIGFYWGHRLSHQLPWLWRFHAVHHSAEHVGYLTNTRAHPVDMVLQRLFGLALLYATGLATTSTPKGALIPALVLFIGSIWSYFIHANIKIRLPIFEYVLSTPGFHHWHHTREDHKDRNYSSMLPVMDLIFGTFYLPKHWPAEYGTDTWMPQTVTGQLLEPLAPSKPPPVRRPEPAVSGEAAP